MALERWLFDGWELTEGVARDWEYRSGTDVVSGLDGADTSVPLRDGALFGRRTLRPGTFDLNIWLRATDPEGVRAAWSTLLRAVVRRNRMITVTRHLPSGEVIACKAVLSGQITPTHLGQRGVRCTLTFTVPSGKWLSQTSYTMTSTVGAGASRTLTLTDFEPSTAPMELRYSIYGPFAYVKVTDQSDTGADAVGEWFEYSTPGVPASQGVQVHSDTWDLWGIGGHTPDKALLKYDGGTYLTVEPALPGQTPKVKMDATATGTGTKLVVTGQRAYLV